ncbi:CocE/NonD family hydrolase [Candidatus Palauibacter sp.]|uniref:CocE/NonD family hydrolase n=1 Tax=Candidatus Palauibacter sp. TaxID=3101350 RepID=UPI003B5CFC68
MDKSRWTRTPPASMLPRAGLVLAAGVALAACSDPGTSTGQVAEDGVTTGAVALDRFAANHENPYADPEARFEIRVETDAMVPMRDGVRLATDLYLPVEPADRGDALPVVLIRLPYDKASYRGGAIQPARFFAGQGYAVVVQDVRGKYASEGRYLLSAADREDGYDAVEWASTQPWSNGKVGTFGCSYLGENQTQLMTQRHPAHAAAIPLAAGGSIGSAGGRYGYFGIFEGGAFGLSASFGWFRGNGRKLPGGEPSPAVEMFAALRELPTIDLMRKYGPPDRDTDWEEILSTPLADEWWDQLGYLRDDDRFDTPALHVNSWYDLGANETLQQWRMMQDHAVSERGGAHQFVILSPTSHCMSERATQHTVVGDIDFGDARLPYRSLYLAWFDYWLRGDENGVTRIPKVHYYVMGRNEWASADTWPPPGAEPTRLYLHSGGSANTRFGDGTLTEDTPGEEPADLYAYDPGDPVPSRGGSVCCTGNPADQPGAFDQSDIEGREDVLVYTGDPIGDGGLEVAGPLEARLHVSSDAPDTDFTVKLLDVHPDGRAINIVEGITRARYRDGYEEPVMMEEGEIYPLRVDLHSVAHWFAPGHHVRIEVSSSNFPRFDRNLNTGGNNYDETEWRVARNTIHHSREHASHVVLPVMTGAR